jgi:DNA invertase Pin-like site-specific DNA recombinase
VDTLKTAVALLRVSKEADHEQGLGQRHDIEAFAMAHGITIVAWHSEIAPGALPLERRPVLGAALEAVAARRASMLLVARRDRASRDPRTILNLEELLKRIGAELVSSDGSNGDDPSAEMMRGMRDVFARYERRMISLRTRATLAALAASGVKLGRPAGRKDSGPRKKHPGARPVGRPKLTGGPAVETLVAMRAARLSWAQIAKATGVTPSRARRLITEAKI